MSLLLPPPLTPLRRQRRCLLLLLLPLPASVAKRTAHRAIAPCAHDVQPDQVLILELEERQDELLECRSALKSCEQSLAALQHNYDVACDKVRLRECSVAAAGGWRRELSRSDAHTQDGKDYASSS